MIERGEYEELNALADGEVDADTARSLQARMKTNPRVAAEFATVAAVKAKLNNLPAPEISSAFLNRVMLIPQPSVLPVWGEWRNMAASLIFVALLSSGATYALFGRSAGADIADAVAASHRRSLLAASPIDVASSDSHTVKPWLDARIGISPPTIDMKTDGFTLLGGRVDVIGERTVPTLVYQHNEHLISVVAEPLRSGAAVTMAPQHVNAGGMQMVHLSANGFSYWVVSDAEWKILDEFVSDYRAKIYGASN